MNKTPVLFQKNRYKPVGGVAHTKFNLSIHFVIDNSKKVKVTGQLAKRVKINNLRP